MPFFFFPTHVVDNTALETRGQPPTLATHHSQHRKANFRKEQLPVQILAFPKQYWQNQLKARKMTLTLSQQAVSLWLEVFKTSLSLTLFFLLKLLKIIKIPQEIRALRCRSRLPISSTSKPLIHILSFCILSCCHKPRNCHRLWYLSCLLNTVTDSLF